MRGDRLGDGVLAAALGGADERQGRSIRVRAAYARMDALLAYLTENCCQGEACLPAPSTSCEC